MDYPDIGSGKSTYTGLFVNGIRQGRGKIFFQGTGEEYEGEWACDEPLGLEIFQHRGPIVGMSNDVGRDLDVGEGGVEVEGTKAQDITPQTVSYDYRPRRCRTISPSMTMSFSTVSSYNIPCSSATEESVIMFSGLDNDPTHASISKPNDAAIASTLVGSRSNRGSDITTSSMESILESLSVINFNGECNRLYKYVNGDTFEGYLDKISGLRQGSGVYIEHRMLSRYDGDWRDSKRHGTGHLQIGSGLEYRGEFFHDKVQGEGSLTIGGFVYTVRIYSGRSDHM
jgi:hypothetical protein